MAGEGLAAGVSRPEKGAAAIPSTVASSLRLTEVSHRTGLLKKGCPRPSKLNCLRPDVLKFSVSELHGDMTSELSWLLVDVGILVFYRIRLKKSAQRSRVRSICCRGRGGAPAFCFCFPCFRCWRDQTCEYERIVLRESFEKTPSVVLTIVIERLLGSACLASLFSMSILYSYNKQGTHAGSVIGTTVRKAGDRRAMRN
jgi:hypothetical protein